MLKLFALENAYKLAGIFTAAFILVKIPYSLFNSLFTVLLPNISDFHASKNKYLLNMYMKKSSMFIILFSLVLVIGFFLFGEQLMVMIYGPEFYLESIHMTLMSAIIGVYLMVTLFRVAFIGMGRVKSIALAFISSAVLITILSFAFIPVYLFFGLEAVLLSVSILLLLFCTGKWLLVRGDWE